MDGLGDDEDWLNEDGNEEEPMNSNIIESSANGIATNSSLPVTNAPVSNMPGTFHFTTEALAMDPVTVDGGVVVEEEEEDAEEDMDWMKAVDDDEEEDEQEETTTTSSANPIAQIEPELKKPNLDAIPLQFPTPHSISVATPSVVSPNPLIRTNAPLSVAKPTQPVASLVGSSLNDAATARIASSTTGSISTTTSPRGKSIASITGAANINNNNTTTSYAPAKTQQPVSKGDRIKEHVDSLLDSLTSQLQVDTPITMQSNARDILTLYADTLAESVIRAASQLASSRQSHTISSQDISLILAKKLGTSVAGHEVQQPLYHQSLKSSLNAASTYRESGIKRKFGY